MSLPELESGQKTLNCNSGLSQDFRFSIFLFAHTHTHDCVVKFPVWLKHWLMRNATRLFHSQNKNCRAPLQYIEYKVPLNPIYPRSIYWIYIQFVCKRKLLRRRSASVAVFVSLSGKTGEKRIYKLHCVGGWLALLENAQSSHPLKQFPQYHMRRYPINLQRRFDASKPNGFSGAARLMESVNTIDPFDIFMCAFALFRIFTSNRSRWRWG